MRRQVLFMLMIVLFLVANGKVNAQKLYVSGGKMSVQKLIDAIELQTGFRVSFQRETLDLRQIIKMSKGKFSVRQILDQLTGMKLEYAVTPSAILIRRKPDHPVCNNAHSIKITVTDEYNMPLHHVIIWQQSAHKSFNTAHDGTLVVHTSRFPDTLLCNAVGSLPERIIFSRDGPIRILLHTDNLLDEAIVAVGTTGARSRYIGGDTARIGRRQLTGQSISDVMGALSGRVAGMLVTPTSGVHGARYNISLRGRSSIFNGNDPLIVIDGVPFAAGNQSISNITGGNAAGSLSPLSFLQKDNIERVEILKDAAATAMYGSKGGNGVILITTRRAMPGKPSLDLSVSSGISQVTRRLHLMNTRQYVDMRKEALRNDGLTPDAINAPDLTMWDTTHSTDWGRYLVGGLGRSTNAQLSFVAGGERTNFFLGLHHLHETDVFPAHAPYDLQTITANLHHSTTDGRLEIKVNSLYGWDVNRQYTMDITSMQFLAPNAPSLGSEQGNLLFPLNDGYKARSSNLMAGIDAIYHITGHVSFRSNIGYSGVTVWENSQIPGVSVYNASSKYSRCIIDPRLEYRLNDRHWDIRLSGGASWQRAHNSIDNSPVIGSQSQTTYDPYMALSTSLHLTWKARISLDLAKRSDISKRFKKYGNFGSVALAWVFSEEEAIKRLFPLISLGRLRAGYGVTGNDQLDSGYGNNALLPWGVWVAGGAAWETIVKRDISLDLGLVQNRLLVTATWYHNNSQNQLLPDMLFPGTGPMTLYNWPVIVRNSGWELQLTSRNIYNKNFKWTTSINTSLPANKLAAFPGVDSTPFGYNLTVGQSLTSLWGYKYTGLNPQTGVFQFQDMNKDGRLTWADQEIVGNLDPRWYGGMDNTISWRNWQLSALLEWRVQQGMSYQATWFRDNPPGSMLAGVYSNQTTDLLDRWRRPGDKADNQQLTARTNTSAGRAFNKYLSSSAQLVDASFVRLRSISLFYQLPVSVTRKMHLRDLKLSLQGENLLTLTPYKGGDPEIQNVMILPAMKMVSAGIEVRF